MCAVRRVPQEQQRADGGFSASIRTPTTAVDIGRQLGGKGGGAAVLERSGLDLSQSSAEFQAKTDDTGGGGNDGGKVNNGGSGGDGDEGDDDDYFDDGDEEARSAVARMALRQPARVGVKGQARATAAAAA